MLPQVPRPQRKPKEPLELKAPKGLIRPQKSEQSEYLKNPDFPLAFFVSVGLIRLFFEAFFKHCLRNLSVVFLFVSRFVRRPL